MRDDQPIKQANLQKPQHISNQLVRMDNPHKTVIRNLLILHILYNKYI